MTATLLTLFYKIKKGTTGGGNGLPVNALTDDSDVALLDDSDTQLLDDS